MKRATSSARFDAGLKVRREIRGAEHVERSLANTTGLDEDFQRFIGTPA